MRPLSKALLLTSLLAFTSCASTPAWRSASVSPEAPVKTLLVASAYNFAVPSKSYDMTGVDIGSAFEALGEAIKNDPTIVTDAISSAASAMDSARAVNASISQTGAKMHNRLAKLLMDQGFQLYTDSARSNGMMSKPADQEFAWVAPSTAPNTFGSGGMQEGVPQIGSMPMWGDESTGDLLDRLRANEGTREAFASIQGQFVAESGDARDGIYCMLRIFVLGSDEEMLFEAEASGDESNTILGAFDSAFAKISQPVVRS